MGQTDLAVRLLSERHLRDLVPALMPRHRVVVREILRTEVKVVERKNDEVVSAEIDGIPMILHLEFQSSDESGLPLRMLTYHTLLAARHAPLPVRSLIVYLMHRSPPTPPICHWSDDQVCFACDAFFPWTSPISLRQVIENPVLAPIAALTPGIRGEDLERLREAVENAALLPSDRGDLLAITYLLAGRRFPNVMLQSFRRSRGMEDSSTYQAILDEGEQRGLRRAVLALVRRRLGEPPADLADRLASLDVRALGSLLNAVADAPDEASLRALLPTV